MIPYLLIVILLIGLSFKYDGRTKSNRRIWEVIVTISLILLAGLRNRVGSDTIMYEYAFVNEIPTIKEYFKNVWQGDYPEFVWVFINSLCKTLFGSFVAVQMVVSAIFNCLLIRFYKKNTQYLFTALLLSFFVFWFNLSFEVLRESITVVLFINSILLLNERKFAKYLFLSIIMFGIHNFSIVMVLLAPIVLFVNGKILYPAMILIAGLLFFVVDEHALNMLFLLTSDMMSGNMLQKVDSYTNFGNYGFLSVNINGLIKLFVISILFPILQVLLNRSGAYKNHNKYINRFLLVYIIFSILSVKLVITARFLNYLDPLMILSITNILFMKKTSMKRIKKIFIFFFVVYIGYSALVLYRPSATLSSSPVPYDTRYFPYKSIFQEPDKLRESMWGM